MLTKKGSEEYFIPQKYSLEIFQHEVCYGVSFPSTLFLPLLFIRLATDLSWAVSSPSNRTTVRP